MPPTITAGDAKFLRTPSGFYIRGRRDQERGGFSGRVRCAEVVTLNRRAGLTKMPKGQFFGIFVLHADPMRRFRPFP
jgi:hypothetical protein